MNLTFKKFLSVIMAVIIAFSASIIPASAINNETQAVAPAVSKLSSYNDRYHYGIQAPALSEFLFILKNLNNTILILSGCSIFNVEKLEFAAEGFADDILKEFEDETFIDSYNCANNLPLPNASAQRIINVFNIDVQSKVPELTDKINECNKNGQLVKSVIYLVFQTYLKQVISVHVYEKQINSTTYQMICESTYKYGGTETYELDFYYDTEKQLYYSESDNGLFNLGFHFDLSTNTLTSAIHPWQRNFGFCLVYDLLANIVVMDYDTERVKFTYGGKDWMIQFWKGRYFVCPGAEVGIYNRDEKKIGSYYDCVSDDELMNMYLELYHEDELIFSEGPMMHWWLTGFNFSDRYYLPESLTAKGFIEFPSKDMADVFMKSASRSRRLKVEQKDIRVTYEFK